MIGNRFIVANGVPKYLIIVGNSVKIIMGTIRVTTA